MHVTGFRDPFIAPWPALDRMRDSPPTLYGLISGGIHSQGPKTFLYAISPNDLKTWEYLYPLVVDVPSNHRPGGRWGGDIGVNWECTNFLTLQSRDGTERTMVIAGAEGGIEQSQVTEYHKSNPDAPRRNPSYANWFFGELTKIDNDVRFSIGASGLLDWGLFYAANHFQAADGRKLLWGWIKEEDLTDESLAQRGWTGCLGVVRELYPQVIDGVTGALRSSLAQIGNIDIEAVKQSSRVTTLGIRPFVELEQLRGGALASWKNESIDSEHLLCLSDAPLACEVKCDIDITVETRSVSLVVRHSNDRSTCTTITFDCMTEQILVDRRKSTSRTDINTAMEIGSFTLFRREGQAKELEPLVLDVFIDHDVIEVFANERFALATRVYTDAHAAGISVSAIGPAMIESLDVWPLDKK